MMNKKSQSLKKEKKEVRRNVNILNQSDRLHICYYCVK